MDDNNDSDGDDDYGPDDEIDYERLKEDEYRSDASNEESIEALRNLKLYSKSRREGRDFDYTEDISDYEVEQSDVAENDMGREAEQSMADQGMGNETEQSMIEGTFLPVIMQSLMLNILLHRPVRMKNRLVDWAAGPSWVSGLTGLLLGRRWE
ncbi:hypothetical protein CRG98_014987 [Punica granatum]|uniref:Uncharacterized protein n=1 Tax=Punica granatum TaxID=22663 RepID=A0A2I0K7M5_PUNGR|nr:hypothetical protein CRG98_014987 [Punica granatum]